MFAESLDAKTNNFCGNQTRSGNMASNVRNFFCSNLLKIFFPSMPLCKLLLIQKQCFITNIMIIMTRQLAQRLDN